MGRAWVYGDDVNTDVIFPGKYTYTVKDEAEMARHALEDLDPAFAVGVQAGDVIVAGRNWGCGSSREQAVTCLRSAGVRVIIAKSFARIYFRNAVNNGLLPVVCPEAVAAIQPGEAVTVDADRHVISCAPRRIPLSPALAIGDRHLSGWWAAAHAGGRDPAAGRARPAWNSLRELKREARNDDDLLDSWGRCGA